MVITNNLRIGAIFNRELSHRLKENKPLHVCLLQKGEFGEQVEASLNNEKGY